MPYITQERRNKLNPFIDELNKLIKTPGELNYIVTRLAHACVKEFGGNYEAYNAIIGVLECAKFELYRKKIGPYEDTKISAHGDV